MTGMHDARRAVPFGGTAAGAGLRWLYAGSGERANLYQWRWYWQAKMVEHEPGAQRPVSVPGPSFRHSRFDRRKPLARPAEIYRKNGKRSNSAQSQLILPCVRNLEPQIFHGLDRPTVIRKATSQTTLASALEGPAKSCIEISTETGGETRTDWRRTRTCPPRPGLDLATALGDENV